jgi:membrane protease YdiL (CAAX protease family)
MRNTDFMLFLVVSFVISVPAFLISTQQTSNVVTVLLFLIGSYAPALSAWILLARNGTEKQKQSFRKSLRGWAGSGWIAFAVLAPSLIWLLSFGFSILSGETVQQPLWAALAVLPLTFIVNYGEEIGWRGYALPYLMKKFNTLVASLVLGVVWVLFHVALNWQRPVFGALSSVALVLISVILAYMFVNTSSILPGALFHALFNSWGYAFASGQGAESIMTVVIALLGFLAGRLILRYGTTLSINK